MQDDKILDKNNFDAESIPGWVIRKNNFCFAKNRPSERQWMYYKAKTVLQKAKQPKHGGHKTILERWRKDDKYRNSSTSGGWTEEHIKEYDAIALQKQTHIASRTEGRRISQNWVLKDNRQGGQQIPRDQQPDFAQAKKITKRLHDENLKETQTDHVRFTRDQQEFLCQSTGQEFQGLEKFNY